MKRALLALAISTCSFSFTAPSAAQEQIMDSQGRPLPPEESRRLNAKVAELTRTSGLQAATIAGIAERLGLRYSGLSEADLFRRLEAQVARASELAKKVETLEGEVASMTAAARDRAADLLQSASRAFDNGELDTAEQEFEALVTFLKARGSADDALIVDAIRARALSTELSNPSEGHALARAYREAQILEREASRNKERLGDWLILLDQVESDLARFDQVADRAVLEAGIRTAEESMLANVSKARNPREWAVTYIKLGELRTRLARSMSNDTNTALYDSAIDDYAEALGTIDASDYPLEYADGQARAGNLSVLLAVRSGDPRGLLEQGIGAFREAYDLYSSNGKLDSAASMLGNVGVALNYLAKVVPPSERLAMLSDATMAAERAIAIAPATMNSGELATIHNTLCVVRSDLGMVHSRAGDGTAAEAELDKAISSCETTVGLYDRNVEPVPHATARIGKASAILRRSKLSQADACPARLAEAQADANVALGIFGGNPATSAEADYVRQFLADPAFACLAPESPDEGSEG